MWSDVAQARREGLCRECYSDIHGGYAGPVVTRRPIGDLARKRDDEIRALDRWLEAETAARLLGRSVRVFVQALIPRMCMRIFRLSSRMFFDFVHWRAGAPTFPTFRA